MRPATAPLATLFAALLAQHAWAAAPPTSARQGPVTQPIRDGDRLIFPEGARIPRSLTEVERAFLIDYPITVPAPGGLRGPGAGAPDGPVFCVPEYAPQEGIIIAWEAFTTLQTQMVQQITAVGNSVVYIACDTASEQTAVANTLASATNPSVNLSKVRYVVRTTDTVWLRDYGPRYIYQGTPGHQCRAIIDHTYNRPRPNDNAFPSYFGPSYKGHATYAIPLVHGGGNFHLDGLGRGYATRLINNENPSLSDSQIVGYWQSFQNLNTALMTPFPTSIDSTQHIDMWMQIIGDNAVVISDWPNNPGSTQDVICDNAAVQLAGLGYTVTRVPAYSIGGVHYTYTNVVMCNSIVLLPLYSAVPAGANAAALAAFQAALPGKQIIQLNCDAIVPSAGVMHCIVMHIPPHLGPAGPGGGLAPTAYLRTMRGGDTLTPGQSVPIRWVSDDDVLVTSADIQLSFDGGATFPIIIAQNLPATVGAGGSTFNWTVPDRFIRHARLRVVVRDAQGNTGTDSSPGDFRLNGSCRGDWDGNGVAEPADIAAFIHDWLADLAGSTHETDMDGDSTAGPSDIAAFVNAWLTALTNGC
ncbi:MAG: agmatine deiminase family protein [Phycisphaeraceae bacterium]|nr:agmatine deiminase family protein [Phycisphaeraceae bacterium]